MIKFIQFILIFIILIFGLGYWRTYQMQNSPEAKEFLKGTLPENLDGFYKGSAAFPTGPWQGKKFDFTNQTGINVLHTIVGDTERFSFKTYTGKGLVDKDLDVVKIDYDVASNSALLKPLLDEIVETESGTLLGKLYLRIPFLPPFSLVYFRLEK